MGKKLPTHHVSARVESSGRWYKLGVGWLNEKGTITIRLDPLVDLGRLQPNDLLIVAPDMYDRSFSGGRKAPEEREDPPPPDNLDDYGDDEIPF